MNKINILICDDEQSSIEENKDMIEELLGRMGIEFSIQCYNEVNINEDIIKKTDLAILDIDFQDSKNTGISLAQKIQKINKWIAVIFVTCHSEYAMEAFRLQVLGYLEKPINKSHLEIVMKKVIIYLKGINFESATFEFTYDRQNVVLRQKNIINIEKIGRKIRIETRQSDYEINDSISTIESRMTDFFLKINSGTIINMNFVTEIVNYYIYLSNGKSFRVARNRLNEVKEKYFLFTNKF